MGDELMLRSKISMSVSAALLLGLVSITGCGSNNTAGNTGDNTGVQPNSVREARDGRIHVNSTRDGMRIRGTGAHNIDTLEMRQELADRIAALPEVRSAHVMLSGKNAYVAVTLHEGTTGINAKGTSTYRAKSSTTPHNYGPTGVMSGTGRVKIGRDGMNDTGMIPNGMNETLNGTINTVPGTTSTGPATRNGTHGMGMGILGTDTGTGTRGTGIGTRNHDNGPLLNSSGAKRDVDMGIGKGLGTGMGMRSTTPTHNNNTVNTKATDNVTKEIKDKIAAEVKKHDPKINAVYVSANPDFVERVNYYADEVRAGRPIKGFVDEFRTMVERIFPTRNY